MWANSPKDYENFCRKVLDESRDGIIADIGCGTLASTYKAYAENSNKDLYLCDLSLEMIKIGKQRIEKLLGNSFNIKYLRSDALNMPFKDNAVQTVFSFGIFHIFEEPQKLIQEFHRILEAGGKIFLTSLCTDRKFSGKYLNMRHKKGHVAKPMSSIEIMAIIEENGFHVNEYKVKGGMMYISGTKSK